MRVPVLSLSLSSPCPSPLLVTIADHLICLQLLQYDPEKCLAAACTCTPLHTDKFYCFFFLFRLISNRGKTMLQLPPQGRCGHLDHLVTTPLPPPPPLGPPRRCCCHLDLLAAAAVTWTASSPLPPPLEPPHRRCHHHLDHLATTTAATWTASSLLLPPLRPPCCCCPLDHLVATATTTLLINNSSCMYLVKAKSRGCFLY